MTMMMLMMTWALAAMMSLAAAAWAALREARGAQMTKAKMMMMTRVACLTTLMSSWRLRGTTSCWRRPGEAAGNGC
jgi:hypothetical protein